MKRVMIILVFLSAVLTYDSHAQTRMQGERIEQRRGDRNQFRNEAGRGRCKKAKIGHHRKVRRMAAIDGRITPRERRMLQKERRRRVF
ncbi:MAG: hypothetical protein WAT46_05855 [Saprospiraceae bacterium]